MVPIATTRPPLARVSLMRAAVDGRHAKPLGIRVLVRLERRHAGVQHERCDADALGDEPGDELGRERAPGARHLRAARFARVHVLVDVERPVARDVAVADRATVHREVGEDRVGKIERRDPQAGRRLEARREVDEAAADEPQCEARADLRTTVRSRGRSDGAARPATVRPATAATDARRAECRPRRARRARRRAFPMCSPRRGRPRRGTAADRARAHGRSRRSARCATIIRTASRVIPRASGGSVASRTTMAVMTSPRRRSADGR